MEEELTDRQILRIAQMIHDRLMAMRAAKYGQAIRCLDNLAWRWKGYSPSGASWASRWAAFLATT